MVVEPVVLYAASAWAPAAKKMGTRKRLDAIQRGFCQKIIKAYRTVSLNAVLVLAGILPLDLRIQEAASLYEVRRGILLPELGDREVERQISHIKLPHPANRIVREFVSLTDRDQLNSHNDQAVRIYTDGSKIEGKVGAALSVWSDEAETKALKLKLDPCCTVYQAELLAVSRATSLMVASKERTFGLYTDSRSSLDAVIGQRSFHPLVVEIRGNLEICHTQNKKISLFWVKAHAGLEGNERADELAKQAALNLKRKPDYDKCPVSFVKRHLRTRTLDEWNRRYKSGKTAKTTRLFYPDAIRAYRVTRCMEHTALLTQILTGHGAFSKYLHRFKCKEDPSCVCAPGVEESVEHVLFECPVTEKHRMDVEWETGLRITEANAEELIMSGGRRTEAFLNYCRCVALMVVKRNKTDI